MAAIALASCASPDACDGIAGTCAAIDVYGNGVSEIDQLLITVNGQSKSTQMLHRALPVEVAAAFQSPPTGMQTIDIVGILGGHPIGEGTTSITLTAGAHLRTSVTLTPRAFPDGGAPLDAASDAAPSGCNLHADCASLICQDHACVSNTDILYVDNVNGACTGPHLGNQTDPLCDIPQTIGKPFVHVAGSTHAYGPLSFMGTSVVLVGPGGRAMPSAKLTGGSASAVTVGANAIVTLDGFEITSSLADGVKCATGAVPTSSSITVRDCWIHDVAYSGVELDRCDVVLDRDYIGPANAQGGVLLSRANYSITNCFIVGNGQMGPGVAFYIGGTGLFSHNTVVGNLQPNVGAGVACTTGMPITIENSIIWMNSKNNGTQVYGCTLSNVDIDEAVDGGGNRSVAPDFVSVGFDYHLSGRTANNLACCVDQIAASPVEHDYDGRARPINGKWDVGAHEVP